MRVAIGAYPGSFDPPTVAHLAIARAAVEDCGLGRVDLVVSESALGKEGAHAVDLEDRVAVLRAVAGSRPWLGVVVTSQRLLVDIASGYDVVVMGADKWAQVVDPAWYGGSTVERDAAVARLPMVAVAARPGHALPDRDFSERTLPDHALPGHGVPDHEAAPVDAVLLDVHAAHGEVSSTAVRAGAHDWLVPEAAAFAARTGAWIDVERYRRWRGSPNR